MGLTRHWTGRKHPTSNLCLLFINNSQACEFVESLPCQPRRDLAGWKGTAKPRSLTRSERGEIRPALSLGMGTKLLVVNARGRKHRHHVRDRSRLADKTIQQHTRWPSAEHVGQDRVIRSRVFQGLAMQSQDGCLGACHERAAHLDTGGAEGEGGYDATRVTNAYHHKQ
jgi:hypothetical protein